MTLPFPVRRALRRGLASLRTNNAKEAARKLDDVTRNAPQFPDGWRYRAVAAQRLGDMDKAREAFEMASQLAPERADITLDHGRFLLEAGDAAACLSAMERAADQPDLAEIATLGAAEALLALNRREEALDRLKIFAASHLDAWRLMARTVELLGEAGRNAEAVELLEEARRRRPGNIEVALLLPPALRALARHAEADEVSRELASTPESPHDAWLDLAVSAAQRGNRQEAVRCACKALERNPRSSHAGLILADLSDEPAPSLAIMLAQGGEATMHFARARLLDRMGQHVDSWREYETANQLASDEDGAYDPTQQEIYGKGLTSLDADFLARAKTSDADDRPQPLFICGVSRSGTTLVEQMLASHPSGTIRAGGEMRAIHRLLRRELGPDQLVNTGPRLATMPQDDLERLIEAWRASVRSQADGKAWITDKMPSNAFLLGLLHAAFPRVPLFLMERDPVALACSCFVTPFAEGHFFSRRLETIAHYFAQYRRIIKHWEEVLPPDSLVRVRYESLVKAPQETLAPVLKRLNLEWDDRMLEFHRRTEPVATASLVQVRQPLDPRALSRWRRFDSWLEPWRERLETAYWNGEATIAAHDKP